MSNNLEYEFKKKQILHINKRWLGRIIYHPLKIHILFYYSQQTLLQQCSTIWQIIYRIFQILFFLFSRCDGDENTLLQLYLPVLS